MRVFGSRLAKTCLIAALAGCSTGAGITPAGDATPVAGAGSPDPQVAAAGQCGFAVAFSRTDEGGAETIDVYEGRAEPALGGARPLAFVSNLKVNTDGTRISYKVDDPRAEDGAINDIRNALNRGRTIAEFEEIAADDWEPLDRTWRVINEDVIEKDAATGKPCVAADGYLVSMTSDVAIDGGFARQGDCDQSKWLDALTIPALVLPNQRGGTEFDARGATNRSLVVVMTLDGPRRFAYGIVGDKGPSDEVGEASVEMNRMLNGLPAGSVPRNYDDAVERYQGPRSVILVLPGEQNRLARPITAARVESAARGAFEAWGGEARLAACLGEIPEAL